jgi:hypothetical protein
MALPSATLAMTTMTTNAVTAGTRAGQYAPVHAGCTPPRPVRIHDRAMPPAGALDLCPPRDNDDNLPQGGEGGGRRRRRRRGRTCRGEEEEVCLLFFQRGRGRSFWRREGGGKIWQMLQVLVGPLLFKVVPGEVGHMVTMCCLLKTKIICSRPSPQQCALQKRTLHPRLDLFVATNSGG